MRKALTYILILLHGMISNAQEYVGMTADDLENEIIRPMLRNAARSATIDNYEDQNASAPKGVTRITVSNNQKTQRTTIFEKGYIISETEDSPSEKSICTYLLEDDGKLSRLSKRITRYNKKGEVTDEYSDIATFFSSTDTINEIHNYNDNFHNYTYIKDANSCIIKKIYTSNNSMDTTIFTYNEKGDLTSERISNNGLTIEFEYDKDRKLTSEKRKIIQNGREKYSKETSFTYDDDKVIQIQEMTGSDTTQITLKRDIYGRIIHITAQDGGYTNESTFEYNTKNFIVKDGQGYNYKYKFDDRGNWTHCVASKKGQKSVSYNRDITYERQAED